VPCALPGAILPGDFKIKPTKMRGVESGGMLCSGKELGVPDEVDGLLLLPADAPVGASIRDYLDLDDHSIELKITPNRADCLGMRGIAREVAALTGAPLTAPALPAVAVTLDERRAVTLRADAACGRYLGRVIRGVNQAAPTPDWMKTRLARAGLRSISAIVDVTNYILLEQGQPLHAFDLASLQGGIVVRMAEQGETLTLLNGKEQALDADMLVIADEHKAVALAGVMGGANSEVSDSTQDVFLESAYFAPEAIAGRARRLGFSSDASFRYERGVDFTLQAEAMERATALILDICGGQAGPVTEAVGQLPARAPVKVRVARVNQVLGLQLSADDMAAMFARLGFVAQADGEGFLVTPPSFRFDIAIEEDLIEEVARLYGYDNIPSDAPQARARMLAQPETLTPRGELRRRVAARDYQEIVSYAFVDSAWERDFAGNADAIRLLNPIASQMSVMRSSLLGSLLQVIKHNVDRRAERVRVFELGRVFRRDATVATSDADVRGVAQPMHVAAAALGPTSRQGWQGRQGAVDFYDVKGDVEALLSPRQPVFEPAEHPALHPGRSARVLLDGQTIGFLGELHPRWRQQWELPQAPILFELALDAVMQQALPQAQPVPRQQPVERDIAVVVPESVTHAALTQAIHAAPTEGLLRSATLFDIYRPKPGAEGQAGMASHEKSLAVRLVLGSTHDTLTDERIDAAVKAVLERLATELGARLRA